MPYFSCAYQLEKSCKVILTIICYANKTEKFKSTIKCKLEILKNEDQVLIWWKRLNKLQPTALGRKHQINDFVEESWQFVADIFVE